MKHWSALVGVATAGRREVLTDTLMDLSRQSRPPNLVLVCPASSADVDEAALSRLPLSIVVLPPVRGLPRQRNLILDRVGHIEGGVLTFFDDDFLPGRDYLREASLLFERWPDVALASGLVLADGATGPGLSIAEGRRILEEAAPDKGQDGLVPLYNGYGCNMSVRLDVVNRHGLRFDEDLPLYGWLEDVDFSRRVAVHGRIVQCGRLQGVHLGAKSGRVSGRRTGYSQIANPWHLVRKRTLSPNRALIQVGRNVAANLGRSIAPEPWVDRRGRLRGNLLALLDLARGKLHPRNILRMN